MTSPQTSANVSSSNPDSFVSLSATYGTTRHDTSNPENAVSYILSDEFVCVTMGLRARATECYHMSESLAQMGQETESKAWNEKGLEADRIYNNLTNRWAAAA